jgi:hypothetical protein
MDLPSILFYIAAFAVSVFILYNGWQESQRLRVSWSTLAEQLGLQQEEGAHLLAGERAGVSVQSAQVGVVARSEVRRQPPSRTGTSGMMSKRPGEPWMP